MKQHEYLEELLGEWNWHQMVHHCYYEQGSDSGVSRCPSTYGYFDKFVESRLNEIDRHDLFEFLVDKPNVRISGRGTNEPDFRSDSETDGFPVEISHTRRAISEQLKRINASPSASYNRGGYVRQTPTQPVADDSVNEVDPSATKGDGIILEQILTALNNIDKSLAVLVESSKTTPVVVSVDPDVLHRRPYAITTTLERAHTLAKRLNGGR